MNTKLLHSVLCGTLSCMGPLGRKLAGAFASGDHHMIANCEMPNTASETFIHDYAAYNLLRKYEDLETGIDTRSQARAAWVETEVDCLFLNTFWRAEKHGPLVHSVTRKIAEVLGIFDPDEFFRSVGHSGGASTQRRRAVAAIENKESDAHRVTLEAAPLLRAVQRHMGYYSNMVMQNYSNFSTVPKDSRTDRPILIENQGNMHLQKAVGKMIRRRLHSVGVDLNDQTINQRRAALPDIATIDLSSASDLIWSGLIPLLLPQEWSNIILRTRCGFTNFDGSVVELQKIGGMGNGFVFELESLLFWAISKAAIELSTEFGPIRSSYVTVYGDDIIVDSTHAVTVMQALQNFGFRVNSLKSYWYGPFRESCGFHYHNGKLITPVYIKTFDFSFGAWYHLYNSLKQLANRIDINLDRQLSRIRHYLKSEGEWNYVPPSFGLRAGIHAEWDEATPRMAKAPRNQRKPWFQGWEVRVWEANNDEYHVCQLGAYLSKLREIAQRGPTLSRVVGRIHIAYIRLSECDVLSGGYNNNRGDRRFNLRVGSRVGQEAFSVKEIAYW